MVLDTFLLSAGSLLVISMTCTRFLSAWLLHTGVVHLSRLGHLLMLSRCVQQAMTITKRESSSITIYQHNLGTTFFQCETTWWAWQSISAVECYDTPSAANDCLWVSVVPGRS